MSATIVYHRTTRAAADAIKATGFRDSKGFIVSGVAEEFEGVFISDTPLTTNEGAKGPVLLQVDLDLDASALKNHEIVEDEKPYREWLVPAVLLNVHGSVQEIED